MKKLLSFLFIFLCVFALASCGEEPPVEEKSITFEVLSIASATVGDEVEFSVGNVENAPEGYTVTWSITPESVATIDDTGKVTCLTEGSATISATIGEVTKTTTITINKKELTALSSDDLNIEIIGLFEEYDSADSYSILLTMNGLTEEGTQATDTVEVVFNSEDDAVTSLKMVYKTNNTEVAHLYTKDGKSYMFDGTNKTFTTLAEGEAKRQAISCSFAQIVENVALLEEVDFYTALKEGTVDGDYFVYELDFTLYEGNVLDLEGKTSVTLRVNLQNEGVFEIVIVEDGQNQSVKLELLGNEPLEVVLPSDVSSYTEATIAAE